MKFSYYLNIITGLCILDLSLSNKNEHIFIFIQIKYYMNV